ncbi:hypothetical protein BJP29_22620 [Bacteroides fragilis]|nr:hypothetical protein BJP29_22620 [Bacteroides fragilis]
MLFIKETENYEEEVYYICRAIGGIIYTGHAQGVQWIYQQKQEKKT